MDRILLENLDQELDRLGYDFDSFFYKRYGSFLRFYLGEVFAEFFQGLDHIGRLDYANLVLIPKKDDADYISDYHPISLLNTSFKLITKVLSNCLHTFMKSLLSPSQSAFTKDRSLLMGVTTT